MFLFASIVAAAGITKSPTQLIIDTDMSSDCDDVGAVCMAHALMMRGEANLLAVVHNTGLDTGVGAISAINTYYGQHVPIGAYKGQFNKGLRGSYVDDLAKNFPNKITNASQVPDALKVYRQALAAAPNGSVWIASIGFTTNLESLLKSGPDEESPLNGTELVRRKVQGLAWMGGRYPNSHKSAAHPNLPSPEHNFAFHCSRIPRCSNESSAPIAPSTAFVYEHWPASVPIVFLGWEVGAGIRTGGIMTNATPPANPCRQAYIDHGGLSVDRESWDPATTLFAVRGAGDFYTLQGGRNVISPDGNNAWVNGSDSKRSYLIQRSSPEAVRRAIDKLLVMPPSQKTVIKL